MRSSTSRAVFLVLSERDLSMCISLSLRTISCWFCMFVSLSSFSIDLLHPSWLAACGGEIAKDSLWGHPTPRQRTSSSALLPIRGLRQRKREMRVCGNTPADGCSLLHYLRSNLWCFIPTRATQASPPFIHTQSAPTREMADLVSN